MKRILLITCVSVSLLTGCVSSKKYNLLEADYQRAGEAQRGYEQEHRILQVELQDLKQKVARLEAENHQLDSINHELHRRIMFENAGENWKEKYETLLQAYEKLAPAEKTRGAEDNKTTPANPNTTKYEKKTGKVPPPIVKRDKAYIALEKAKEVKLPEATKEEPKKDESKKEEPPKENTATTKEPEKIATDQDQETRVTQLNTQIQQVLDSYKLGENVKQNQYQMQITISFSDDVLFENEDAQKFSNTGEELLNKLVYTFSQYPRLTIDIVSEGDKADEKVQKISQMFSQYNIKTRIISKNSVPLAFETSGTQKAISMFTLRVE